MSCSSICSTFDHKLYMLPNRKPGLLKTRTLRPASLCIISSADCPAVDWFLVYHLMNFNQSSLFTLEDIHIGKKLDRSFELQFRTEQKIIENLFYHFSKWKIY